MALSMTATASILPGTSHVGVLEPTVAYADEMSDLLKEATDIKEQLSQAKDDYLAAVQQQEEAAGQVHLAKQELEKIQGHLDDTQGELATVVRAQYKTSVDFGVMDLVVASEDLQGLTEALDYLDHVEGRKTLATMSVKELRDAQADAVASLEDAERAAKQAADTATQRQHDLESRQEELRPRIDALMGDVRAKMADTSGDSQFSEVMSFIENFQSLTDTQLAIVRSAYKTGYAGYFYCEAWVEYAYENADVPIDAFACAYDCYDAYLVSEDYDVPVGALVWCSGGSPEYSHVGICVFNGGTGKDSVYIMDNEASRAHKAIPLTEWEKCSATSIHNGKNGWFGWGYPTGVKLV